MPPTLGSPEGTPVETPYVPDEMIDPIGSEAGNRILDDQGWLIDTTEPETGSATVLDDLGWAINPDDVLNESSDPVINNVIAESSSPIVSEVAQEPISSIGSPSSGSSSLGMSPGFGDVGGFAPPGMGANAAPPGMGGNAALGGSLLDPDLVSSSTTGVVDQLSDLAPPPASPVGPSDSRGGMLSRLADQLNAGPVETPYVPPEVYDENMGGVPLPPPPPMTSEDNISSNWLNAVQPAQPSLPSLDMPSLDVQMPSMGTMGADLPPTAALAPLPGTILAPSNRALSPNAEAPWLIDQEKTFQELTPANRLMRGDRPENEPEPTPKRKKAKAKRPTKKQLAARRAFLQRGGSFLAEGGDTGDVVEAAAEAPQSAESIMQDPITQEAVLFIMGESDNQQSVNNFIAKYGNEMFLQLRDSVLQSLVPGAQTEGLIAGDGQSGMADDIPGMIGADEKIAVSQDEFIVPADVVSALGDGSSDAGSNRLYEMMDRVRQAKTGGVTQPAPINVNKVMPG